MKIEDYSEQKVPGQEGLCPVILLLAAWVLHKVSVSMN